jgi:hypothetical protein
MSNIFCNTEGVLDWDAIAGGPIGGKGLEDIVTIPGLWKDGELESRLEVTDEEFEFVMLGLSAASSKLGLAIDFLDWTSEEGRDSLLVKVRVKKGCFSSTSHMLMIILA